MELCHLLPRSGLTYPEVSSNVYHSSFCQLGNSVSLPCVIYYEAFYLHLSKRTIFRIEVTVQNKADNSLFYVLGILAFLDDIKYTWFFGQVLELMKLRKLRNSTKIFQRLLLPCLIVKYTLKSLKFRSDIPTYTAIGSIMSVVICLVYVRRKCFEANAGRR
jgi:hypothetical protein